MDLVRERDRLAAGSGAALLRGLRRLGVGLLRQPRGLAVLPPIAWMGLIWFLSSGSVGPQESSSLWPSFFFNLAHGPEYAILTVLLLPLLPRRDGWVVLGGVQMALVIFFAGSYGVIDELHQGGVPGRSRSVGDALTDLGAIAAVLIVARYVAAREATGRGLVWRLLAGAALVVGGAAVATFEHLFNLPS